MKLKNPKNIIALAELLAHAYQKPYEIFLFSIRRGQNGQILKIQECRYGFLSVLHRVAQSRLVIPDDGISIWALNDAIKDFITRPGKPKK